MGKFPGFEARVAPFLRGDSSAEDVEEYKRLFCADCAFFTPGEDEDLECGCYHILMRLMERRVVTLEQLADALGD